MFLILSEIPTDAMPFVIDPLGYLNYKDYFATKPALARFGDNPSAGMYLLRRTLRTSPLSPGRRAPANG